jgi:hypothetical protein
MPNDKWYDENDNPSICSIEQMLELVKQLGETKDEDGKKNSIYFRGQEWKDKLLPAIGRKPKFCGEWRKFSRTSEKDLLHRFRRWAYLELKRPVSEWEALFLGRHHGLPVRLLDWTSNPLFALYFASEYEKEPEGDAAVWVIIKDNSKDIDVLKEEQKHSNPFKVEGVRILYPFYASPRMNAQQSFFTIQDNPWMPLEKYVREGESEKDRQNKHIQIKKLIKCKVPNRKSIIKELVRIGIHNQVLYPDLDGLTKGLWQIEVVRGWK